MPKKFQRNIEDFTCGHCGAKITGNGYTNHCPKCLWSKHVDINPGDRINDCKGLMKPVGVEFKAGQYSLIHHCQKCRSLKKNKTADNDNFDELLKLSKSLA